MPASQATFTEIMCVACTGLLVEDECTNYEEIHDNCYYDSMWTCETCNTDFVIPDVPNSRDIARITGLFSHYSVHTDDGYTLCDDCVYCCENSDRIYGSQDSMLDCCYNSRHVNYYSYRPQFKFYGDNPGYSYEPELGLLYMGVEIEMVRAQPFVSEFLEMADEKFDAPKFFYFKEDGSIGHDGAELVTMPATYEQFERWFPFDTLNYARENWRFRSFEYDSCGFHIHVSRTAFTATHMWRFVMFQLKNPALCQYVGQRETSMYATWNWESYERDSIPDYVKGKKSNGRRYLAINFQNTDTIELRYFKGNILEKAILKNLQFVKSMFEYTKNMSYRQVQAGALSDTAYRNWLDEQSGYDELKSYLSNVNKEEE